MRTGRLALALACSATLWARASAEVVVTGSSGQQNDTAPSITNGASDWANVGSMSNYGSCVYIGNGWVLSADHVWTGSSNPNSVAFNGITYDSVGSSAVELTNPNDGTAADLILFKLTSTPAGLSNMTFATSEPKVGSTIYSVGYGISRGTDGPHYYQLSGSSTNITWTSSSAGSANEILYEEDTAYGNEIWGSNTIATGTTEYYNVSPNPNVNIQAYISFFGSETNSKNPPASGDAQQIAIGDSGGGVFNAAGQLVGINDLEGILDNQPEQGSPAGQTTNTAAIADASYYADIYDYESQIESITGVPEPGVGVAFLGTAGVLIRRRSRHQFA